MDAIRLSRQVNAAGHPLAPDIVVIKPLPGRQFFGGLLVAFATTACGNSSPAAPTPPATASVTITSIAVAAEQQAPGGYTYRAVLQLREMNGVTATIVAADLTFFAGTTSLVTSHQEHPISDGSNICPANGTISSRELMTADSDLSHSYATSVKVAVTFTDPLSHTGTATATADVPPPATPPPEPTFTLAGVVSDESTGRAIRGASVSVVDGANAGRESSTDGNGYYSIPDLSRGGFTVRAIADRYESRDTGITFEADTRLDLKLRPINNPPPPACVYSISPTAQSVQESGGSFTATITRTSGSCTWQARSDSSWISFPAATSGSGSGTLRYVVERWAPVGPAPRTGIIVVEWSSGSVRLTITQAGEVPPPCAYQVAPPTLTVPLSPSAGQTFSFAVSGIGPGCPWQATTSDGWIHFLTWSGDGNSTIPFLVDPLSSGSRTGTITVSWFFAGSPRNTAVKVVQQ